MGIAGKETGQKLTDMRVKERLFGNTYVLYLYSLPAGYVASWMLQHNHGYIMFWRVKHCSEIFDSIGIRDA
jgi:hypothetical protein